MKQAFLSAAIAACDLYLKNRVENAPESALPKEVCGGRLVVTREHNNGAMLNHLSSRPELVLAGSGAISGAIAMRLASLRGKKGHALERAALTMILGGAASNLIDRVYRGYVVDYLQIPRGRAVSRVVFNLGDVFVLLGAALLAVRSLFGRNSVPDEEPCPEE